MLQMLEFSRSRFMKTETAYQFPSTEKFNAPMVEIAIEVAIILNAWIPETISHLAQQAVRVRLTYQQRFLTPEDTRKCM